MHYITLVAVDIPEVEDEPEIDEAIKSAIEELRKKDLDEKKDMIPSIVRGIRLRELNARLNAFAGSQ